MQRDTQLCLAADNQKACKNLGGYYGLKGGPTNKEIFLELSGVADFNRCKGGSGTGCVWFAVGIIPGGKLAKAGKAGKNASKAVSVRIVASDGTEVVGFTGHGIDRTIGDGAKRAGVKPRAILDAIRNPTRITEGVDNLGRPFKVYVGANARVVVNPRTGLIVSVNPRSGAGANR